MIVRVLKLLNLLDYVNWRLPVHGCVGVGGIPERGMGSVARGIWFRVFIKGFGGDWMFPWVGFELGLNVEGSLL